MDLQIQKDLSYLKESFINGGLNILGLLKEAEDILKRMSESLEIFLENCQKLEEELNVHSESDRKRHKTS